MRIGGRTLCSLATLLSLALLALARQHAALREESFDAIIVLAGVDSLYYRYQRFMPSCFISQLSHGDA